MNKINCKFRKKVYCRKCKLETHHDIILIHSIGEELHDVGFSWQEDYMIGQCRGCDTNNFIKEYDDSNMHYYIPSSNEYIPLDDIEVYPPEPLKEKEKYNMVNFKHLPELLDTLYNQVVANFELNYYLLSAAGLRMIIEGICNDLSINDGYVLDEKGIKIIKKDGTEVRSDNLNGKINGLEESGILTEDQTKILHLIRKFGNQTVHDLINPTRKIMLDGIEIIEQTLKNIYEFKKYSSLEKHFKKQNKS
ncbi:DUF4145 domain-containing protein [Halobacillus ihumii]|uniref:DUF4145 domain-containing protein n=1 Tax=Halobacillus ihumii TaxID=2686092 RepID=UPI0013D84B62|nr:DUF4145 domain-containing protein [Halobacillus ihumii]